MQTTTYKDPVFFTMQGRATIIDCAVLVEGVYRGQFSGETVEEVAKRYPGAEIGELDDVYPRIEEQFVTLPTETDKDEFWRMLEVLPPHDWVSRPSEESFKMIERTYGNITGIYARIGKRYFCMQNSIAMSHEDIIRCVLVTFPDAARTDETA